MTDITLGDYPETRFAAVQRTIPRDNEIINDTMVGAFGLVWGYMQENGIPPAGAALAVYYESAGDTLNFKAGFTIAADLADKGGDTVEFAAIPACKAIKATHKGPYTGIAGVFQEMEAYIAQNGLTAEIPCWEVYLNDPSTVSEEELLTDLYIRVSG